MKAFEPLAACERIGFDQADTDALLAKILGEGAALHLAGNPSQLQALMPMLSVLFGSPRPG